MAQPARKLDPDQMPSQIQVLEDDKLKNNGVYVTGQRGSVPPLVTSNFIVDDQGLCSPRFLRSTMYNIPCTSDLLKQSHLPFVVTLSPFAKQDPQENKPPIADLGQMGPLRCNRCKAYMCPNMMFIDGGRKFQCCFCSCTTEVPPEYFAHLDHTGKRIDCFEKPELCLGAYEFVATADYCKDNKLPQAPAFIFMIDVSFNSINSGLINLLCTRLKEDILAYLPKDEGDEESEVRVGFVTYSNELHFYNIKNNLVQPQMLVVTDMNDVFVPLVDGFLVKVSEAEAIVDCLLAQIWSMFSNTCEKESVLGPVIQAGLDALRSAERSGKLIIFHSSMPTAEAPGKLKHREDKNLLGSEKEKTLLTPQTNFYTKLGQECVSAGCSVDIFLFPNMYVDVATISEVPRLTGGSLYKYNYFKADTDGEMLMSDLRTNISRQFAFDVVLRLRTSQGIRAVDFFGNFFMSNTTDVELASLDRDKTISIEIRHDDKLTEAEGAYVQAAVLYTSVGGRRRLRVLNSSFNCCTQVADLFRSCELDVIINFFAKQAIRESLNTSVKQVREHLTNQCVQILASYRKNCATPSSSGQLILPECMKLLPVYINSLIKSGILQTENINVDDRSYYIHLVNSMSISGTVAYFYPRLIPLLDIDVDDTSLPHAIRCSSERLKDNGAYLLENGLVIFLWVGLSINAEWIQQVFGVPSVAQIDIDKTKLQDLDNPVSVRVRGMVRMIREERNRYMKLVIVRQRDKLEPVMQMYMVEDRTPLINSSLTYVDFLCHIHKEIRNILL
ncbi:hypothetical protein HELRODRAFT_94513 [Helobdella robusta]|uniref:Uncharacterized protein n=1 Tax=Helobdella robusta TaxID=6412 RepID=T1G915_HELRO|nr:hypothetical protein HELRODRAFT_94513 [Helobdella robusta]ESO02325.1 hypothetical protein HELRODRAFT_94513 [Helobdella robusta]